MKDKIVFLSILTFWTFGRGHAEEPRDFMLLAGPLSDRFVRTSNSNPSTLHTFASSSPDDVFDCTVPLPVRSTEHFQFLQSRGVTHYKVPLVWSRILPTGEPWNPDESTLACYRSLVERLILSGVRPLLVLHRSTLPDVFGSRFRGWEDSDARRAFMDYADLVFSRFGDLVTSYVTFSHVDELEDSGEIQGACQVHEDVYRLYHARFNGKRTITP